MDRAALVALDKRRVWHPYTPTDEYLASTDPLVLTACEGAWLTDMNGRRYLDGNGSWWVSTLGHRHPRLVEALVRQARSLPHGSLAGCTHEPAARLADRLVALAPEGLDRVFYSDNGSTAVEVALKVCGHYWAQNGRPRRTLFLALGGAFHGETLGATSLGGVEAFRRVYDPWTFEVLRAPAPDEPGGWERAFLALERAVLERSDALAAVVLEPVVQGAAGMRIYPPEYVSRVRALTRHVDTFLVADEVFTGLGRTGARWACDLAGVSPDVLCTAKALSGGLLPFAATLVTERIFDGFRGDRSRTFWYGHSYCGNPLGAAVALEALDVYVDEMVLEGIPPRAARIAERMSALGALPGVSNPRALGMVGAVDLGGGGYLSRAGWRVYSQALARGAYLRPLGDTVYLAPALNIPLGDLDALLDALEQSVRAALSL
ncbi:MAG: adenosylmethionine--8-amino-7-oxononanoate transaminase [Deltaproteobacteria bacterium]|nr:adenosylmethionine--8-amino-7-oxononanoate transaminase [Deltaproteobacteria bacterium]